MNESDLPRLAAPAQRTLAAAGVLRLDDLTRFRVEEVSRWHGIGPNALKQLQSALRAHGLRFAGENKYENKRVGR